MVHQVLLIAQVRVRGSQNPTYRCVAEYHKHDCYGTLPLRALLRLFTLLKQPDNADVVREELRALDGQYGEPGKDPKGSDVPCRFLSTVLGSSWDVYKRDLDVDVGGTYLHENLLSVNTKFWGGRMSLCVRVCPHVAHSSLQIPEMGLPSSMSPIRRILVAHSLRIAISSH